MVKLGEATMWRPQTAKGMLFADVERCALWLELLDRCGLEVVQVGEQPDRWLALPIDTSIDELQWRHDTGQGWKNPENAAYIELSFAPPREVAPDEELAEWYWSDAPCETTKRQPGPRPHTSRARKTSRDLFLR